MTFVLPISSQRSLLNLACRLTHDCWRLVSHTQSVWSRSIGDTDDHAATGSQALLWADRV